MSSKGGSPANLGLVARVRAWWDDSPSLADCGERAAAWQRRARAP